MHNKWFSEGQIVILRLSLGAPIHLLIWKSVDLLKYRDAVRRSESGFTGLGYRFATSPFWSTETSQVLKTCEVFFVWTMIYVIKWWLWLSKLIMRQQFICWFGDVLICWNNKKACASSLPTRPLSFSEGRRVAEFTGRKNHQPAAKAGVIAARAPGKGSAGIVWPPL